MDNRKLSEDELKWRAEEDARTLEKYNELIKDKPRLDKAIKVAQSKVENLIKRANALSKSITGIKKK